MFQFQSKLIIINFKTLISNLYKQALIWFLYFFSISSSLGSSSGWEHCIVFLGETRYSQSASVSSQVYK